MTKIVINTCYGGFGLSEQAMNMYCSQLDLDPKQVGSWDIARDSPTLIQIIEQLGQAANGNFAELKIVEVPDDVDWYIEEYDGREWVAERHRTWS